MSESAYASIARLLYVYAERLDAGDLDGMAALFEHATFRGKGSDLAARGSAEVRAAFAGSVMFHDGNPATQHVTSNLYVDVHPDGHRAVAHSAFTVLQQTATLPLQVVCAGRYVDTFELVDGSWRFADREVDIRFFGDVSQHIMSGPDGGTEGSST